jgi:hypothetical protein
MQIQAKERMREIEIWSKVKKEIDDGSFDKDNKDKNQLVSLTRRYIQEAWNAVHNGKNGDISSYNNILAQFEMLVKECYSRGIIQEVISVLEASKKQWVLNILGLNNKPTW